MTDDLTACPFLIELARKNAPIIAQNIAASIVIAVVGLVLAATGTLARTGEFAVPARGVVPLRGRDLRRWATASGSSASARALPMPRR
jgi:hypothetical protein